MKEQEKQIKEQLKQALHKLPLTEAEVDDTVSWLINSNPIFTRSALSANSSLLDFRDKINAVVEHFAQDGLTMKDYLRAVIKQPSLFTASPDTVIGNIEGVVEHFQADGLTTKGYLGAALRSPQLFAISSATVINHVEGVVEHFHEHGLTLRDYLCAAVKQPSLFCLLPDNIIGHIEGVVGHFREQGLTLRNYLRAAVKLPPLFAMLPDTIIGHVNLLIGLQQKGLVQFRGQDDALPGQPLRPLLDFLVKAPKYFCLADDNFTLRELYAHNNGKRPTHTGISLIRQSRYETERELAEYLGHDNLDNPVPKEPLSAEHGNRRRYAENLLLRALIREGVVKGRLER